MDSTPKRVLCCDDEPAVTRLVGLYLEFDGFEVETLNEPLQVLPTLKERPADLVFLDLIMPGLTGEQVLERLRAEEATRELPVIVLTAKSLTGPERARLRRLGASVLSKPFRIHELVQRARQAVSQ